MRLALPLSLLVVTACSAGDSNESVETTGDETGEQALTSNEKSAFEFFVNKGLTKAQAAGIVGNLIQESSMIPTIKQYGGGPGRGIAQWSAGGRWDTSYHDNVVWFANTRGQSPWSLQTQLEFIWYELTTHGYGFSELKSAGNVTDATIAFQDHYEICGQCAQSTRIKFAEQALAAYGGGGGGGSGGGGSFSCYSPTLGKTVPVHSCVQSKYDSVWYKCHRGSWVSPSSDSAACEAKYPL